MITQLVPLTNETNLQALTFILMYTPLKLMVSNIFVYVSVVYVFVFRYTRVEVLFIQILYLIGLKISK